MITEKDKHIIFAGVAVAGVLAFFVIKSKSAGAAAAAPGGSLLGYTPYTDSASVASQGGGAYNVAADEATQGSATAPATNTDVGAQYVSDMTGTSVNSPISILGGVGAPQGAATPANNTIGSVVGAVNAGFNALPYVSTAENIGSGGKV